MIKKNKNSKMKFSVIVATDENNLIGINNQMPWDYLSDGTRRQINKCKHICSKSICNEQNCFIEKIRKDDMKFFKEKTMNQVVVYGYNTWQSLPTNFFIRDFGNKIQIKALVSRCNVVICNKNRAELDLLEYGHEYQLYNKNSNDVPGSIIFYKEFCSFFDNFKLNEQSIFIIGGSNIYEEAFNKAFENNLEYVYKTVFPATYQINSDDKAVYFKDPVVSQNKVIMRSYSRINNILLNQDIESQYLNLLNEIIETGFEKPASRTDTATRSLFCKTLEFIPLFKDPWSNKVPLLTTKKVFFRGIIEELLFFISGETNTKKYLADEKNVHIWDKNTSRSFLDSRGLYNYPEGDMGPTYSFLFAHAGAEGQYTNMNDDYTNQGLNQISELIQNLLDKPFDRRHIISLWSPKYTHKMSLAPCLFTYSFYVEPNKTKNVLHLCAIMRSADLFLGVPFNLVSANIFLRLIAIATNMHIGSTKLIMMDCHLYETHIQIAQEQINSKRYNLPTLTIQDTNAEEIRYALSNCNRTKTQEFILQFKKHFLLNNYQSAVQLKAEMIV